MNDLFELILAAGGKQRDFSWIFPLVLFVVYGISAIGKVIQNKQSQQPDEEKETEQKPRYKPIEQKQEPLTPEQRRAQRLPYAPKQGQPHQPQPRPAAPALARPERHMETVVVEQRSAPIARPVTRQPAPRPVQAAVRKRTHAVQARAAVATKKQIAPTPPKQPLPVAEILPKPALKKSRLAELLTDKNDLRRGIIYSEIFGKPVAIRDHI